MNIKEKEKNSYSNRLWTQQVIIQYAHTYNKLEPPPPSIQPPTPPLPLRQHMHTLTASLKT